jgi:cell division protein ZapA
MAVDGAAKKPVRVTILSRPYTLRTAGDPVEVQALAAKIDELMLTIAERSPNADSAHIAVLACLHLADRLREVERELNDLKERVGQKSEQFAGLLDQLISSAGEP